MLNGFLVTIAGPDGWEINAFVPEADEASPTGAQSHIENLIGQLHCDNVKRLTAARVEPVGRMIRDTAGGSRQEASFSR